MFGLSANSPMWRLPPGSGIEVWGDNFIINVNITCHISLLPWKTFLPSLWLCCYMHLCLHCQYSLFHCYAESNWAGPYWAGQHTAVPRKASLQGWPLPGIQEFRYLTIPRTDKCSLSCLSSLYKNMFYSTYLLFLWGSRILVHYEAEYVYMTIH